MADSKITDLSSLTAAAGDELPVNRAGSDGKVTLGTNIPLEDAANSWTATQTFQTIAFQADATYDIGTSTVGLNDLHIGAAGVINFDGGDVTITHGANELTVAGGNIVLDGGDITSTNSATAITFNPNLAGQYTGISLDNDSTAGGSYARILVTSGTNAVFQIIAEHGANTTYFQTTVGVMDVGTNGASSLIFRTNNNTRWAVDTNGHIVPEGDATYDIGTSTVGINDIHFGLAGVINFDGGDVTITHAANALAIAGGLVGNTAGTATIASGVITATSNYMVVDTENGDASDDLATINGGISGARLVIRAADADNTVVIKDGTGNIQCAGDFSLDNVQDTIELIYDASLTAWLEIGRSDNGA